MTDAHSSPRIKFLSAGAGSGKTYRLTEILRERLVAGELAPAGILATTFTRKAAGELRERVRGHLLEAKLFDLANAMGESRIGTINAVCGELVQRFSFEIGLSPDLRVLDENESKRLLREALDETITPDERRQLTHLAWRFGLKEVDDNVHHIIAQARSNDLSADALREMGSRNSDACIAAFGHVPNEALEEDLKRVLDAQMPAFKEAVQSPKPVALTRTYLATIEKFRAELARDVPTWPEWAGLHTAKDPEKGLVPSADAIREAAGRFVHHPRFAADIREYLMLVFDLAARTLETYRDTKSRAGTLDFIDQEALLLHHLDQPLVHEALKEELQLVVVDEFQDVSPLQLAIFLKLSEIARESVWVGDIKQAIYGFRGSDTALMQSVIAALPQMQGVVQRMDHSWRQRPPLVALTNKVFTHAFRDSLSVEDVALVAQRPERTPELTAYEVWQLPGKNKAKRQADLILALNTLMAEGRQIPEKKGDGLKPLHWKDIAILVSANDSARDTGFALRRAGIPTALASHGLLQKPEAVLALACLRRLYDDRDTLATAEILSLAEVELPEQWLTERLRFNAIHEDSKARAGWREQDHGPDHPASPLLAAIGQLRRQRLSVLTPREALFAVMALADLGRVMARWSSCAEALRSRLANLDALLEMAKTYEDERVARDAPGSIGDFLLWMQTQANDKNDLEARTEANAVSVMTHHAAKGLEWPVVILFDLDKEIRNDLWSIRGEQVDALDISAPLASRFVRHWPWPFGDKKKVPAAQQVESTETGQQARKRALEERRRLLYVSMTRARDLLILAFNKPDFSKANWLAETTESPELLPDREDGEALLPSDWQVPSAFRVFNHEQAESTPDSRGVSQRPALMWPSLIAPTDAVRLPLITNPSSAEPVKASIVKTERYGAPLAVEKGSNAANVGNVVHAALAAAISQSRALEVNQLDALIRAEGVEVSLTAAGLYTTCNEVLAWLERTWPGCPRYAELPIDVRMPSGQICRGQIDLLIKSPTGWVIIDHKTGYRSSQMDDGTVSEYAGQLAVYRDVMGDPSAALWVLAPTLGSILQLARDS
ncbi:UvrD-helicase domain-containing protein [Polycyclovorans algicola]|uniref:UvrD-helicase domain-containing protein n=1 Tax=Polycyclovorans algicola TaxID=616992 RepID=UPI00069455E5|nr:UvrD-helicase domain-containing protein [Polycyclovorans algicola]